jgi:hypothetical protein
MRVFAEGRFDKYGVNSNRNPGFPVETGTQFLRWFPVFAGTTPGLRFSPERRIFTRSSKIESEF